MSTQRNGAILHAENNQKTHIIHIVYNKLHQIVQYQPSLALRTWLHHGDRKGDTGCRQVGVRFARLHVESSHAYCSSGKREGEWTSGSTPSLGLFHSKAIQYPIQNW
jgi:hypothetical protein